MPETRIYRVKNAAKPDDDKLVEASTKAQAIGHVVRGTFTADTASPKEVAELLGKGVKVETAGATEPAA